MVTPADQLPVPTDSEISPQQAVLDAKQQARLAAQGNKESGWIERLWAKFWAALFPGGLSVVSLFIDLFDDAMAIVAKFFTAAQGTNTPGFFVLTAAIIEDLLGVEVDAASMEAAYRRGGNVAGVRAIGGKLFDQLSREFNPGPQVTPEGGIAAGKAFLGFLMAFAIRQGNVSMIADFLPEEIDFIKGIREYGELMAGNLGLGRLARRALQPLIQVLISDPMTWYLNRQYRPKQLSAGQALKAYARGDLSEAETQKILSWEGYADSLQNVLLLDSLTQLAAGEIHDLNRFGIISEDDALTRMTWLGTNRETAAYKLQATRLNDANSAIGSYLTLLRTQRVAGYISKGAFADQVDGLPISAEYKRRWKDVVGQECEFPRAKLTLAEVQTAFVEGLIDVTELGDYLKQAGYSDDDQLTLQYLTLIKLGTLEAKKAVAEYSWNKAKTKAAAKGLPEPPMPAILAQ